MPTATKTETKSSVNTEEIVDPLDVSPELQRIVDTHIVDNTTDTNDSAVSPVQNFTVPRPDGAMAKLQQLGQPGTPLVDVNTIPHHENRIEIARAQQASLRKMMEAQAANTPGIEAQEVDSKSVDEANAQAEAMGVGLGAKTTTTTVTPVTATKENENKSAATTSTTKEENK